MPSCSTCFFRTLTKKIDGQHPGVLNWNCPSSALQHDWLFFCLPYRGNTTRPHDVRWGVAWHHTGYLHTMETRSINKLLVAFVISQTTNFIFCLFISFLPPAWDSAVWRSHKMLVAVRVQRRDRMLNPSHEKFSAFYPLSCNFSVGSSQLLSTENCTNTGKETHCRNKAVQAVARCTTQPKLTQYRPKGSLRPCYPNKIYQH